MTARLETRNWKTVSVRYGRGALTLRLPDDSAIFEPSFPESSASPEQLVRAALRSPAAGRPLARSIADRSSGEVVVVVSDATRPIPYTRILPPLLAELHEARVPDKDVVILIATGLHRATTLAEREQMFGPAVLRSYQVIDHDALDPASLRAINTDPESGRQVRLNRRYVEAGYRIVTGLVEPHFMAGFSGGSKSICPGLCDLETVRRFHGAELLADARAVGGCTDANPVFGEAQLVASAAPPQFSVQVVLDSRRQVAGVFAGTPQQVHEKARALASHYACVPVESELDVVITSCGGYPLDATFYQCIKGIVSCLPAVRRHGRVIAAGSCSEGIGSKEYEQLLAKYDGDWRRFLSDIRSPGHFAKDQWQFQMHCRALEKLGSRGILFCTDGLPWPVPRWLCVAGRSGPVSLLQQELQDLVTHYARHGRRVGVFPEGPYCVPVASASWVPPTTGSADDHEMGREEKARA